MVLWTAGTKPAGSGDRKLKVLAAATVPLRHRLSFCCHILSVVCPDGRVAFAGDRACDNAATCCAPAHKLCAQAACPCKLLVLAQLPFDLNSRGAAETDATLRVRKHSRVFALGDVSGIDPLPADSSLPATAQVHTMCTCQVQGGGARFGSGFKVSQA